MVWTLLVIVLIVVVGVSVLAYRHRSEKGIESGIRSFRRELRALAPESDEGPRAAGPPVDPPRTSGVGVLRGKPEPSEPDADTAPDGAEAHRAGADDDADDAADDGPETGAGTV